MDAQDNAREGGESSVYVGFSKCFDNEEQRQRVGRTWTSKELLVALIPTHIV